MEPSGDWGGAMQQLPKGDATFQSVHCTVCGTWPAPDLVHGDHYCERCAGQFLTPDRHDPSQLPRPPRRKTPMAGRIPEPEPGR